MLEVKSGARVPCSSSGKNWHKILGWAHRPSFELYTRSMQKLSCLLLFRCFHQYYWCIVRRMGSAGDFGRSPMCRRLFIIADLYRKHLLTRVQGLLIQNTRNVFNPNVDIYPWPRAARRTNHSCLWQRENMHRHPQRIHIATSVH